MVLYEELERLIGIPLFITVFLSWFISQTIKIIIYSIKKKKLNLKLYLTGSGMPSTHSATFAALAYGIFLSEGITNLFIVTLIFSLLVMREVIGFRTISIISNTINTILDSLNLSNKKVNEDVGHTIKEVIVGIIIGLITTWFIFNIY